MAMTADNGENLQLFTGNTDVSVLVKNPRVGPNKQTNAKIVN